MKQNLRLFMLTLLCAVFSSAWGQETQLASGTFDGKNENYTTGWSTTGTGKGRNDCIIIYEGEDITAPTLDLSGYDKVRIDIKARRYGTLIKVDGVNKAIIDASIDGTSVGTTEALGTNASTALEPIEFTPTSDMTAVTLVFTCPNANGATTGGAGVNSIVITGIKESSVATPVFSVEEGLYTEAQSVEITCATEGASIYYTIDGEDPTSNSTAYTGAITISETTTLKAIAILNGVSSLIAEATYSIETPVTITEARAVAVGQPAFTKGIVTSIYNRTAYIQDNDAAICIYANTNIDANVGDELLVKGTVKNQNGLLELINPTKLEVLSSNNSVTPEVMSIADVNASTNQGWFVKIVGATVTDINSKEVTITQGDNTVLVYFNNANNYEFAVNDKITLTGNIGCYNTLQIANPIVIEVLAEEEPTLTVAPDRINLDCNGDSGEMTLTTENFVEEPEEILVQFYSDASCETLIDPLDWVSIDTESMTYTVEENTGEARSAYLKVYAFDSESGDYIYSNLITINQAAYVDPNLNGWILTDLANITENDVFVIVGTNADGSFAMSNDKGASNAPTAVSVTLSNDKSELTGEVADNIRWNLSSSSSGYTFYPDGDTETWLYSTSSNNGMRVGTGNANLFTLCDEGYLTVTVSGALRYVGIYNSSDWRSYTSINSNIKDQEFAFYKKYGEEVLTPSIEVDPTGVSVGADGGDGTIEVTYKNFNELSSVGHWLYALDGEEEIECDWINIVFDDDWNVNYEILPNDGEARTAYLVINAWDSNGETASSSTIVFNQAAFVLDFATIPFYFNGGRADIENTDGLTQEGLGSDYGNTAPTTHLKFDGTGDWMILKLDEHPSIGPELAFDIKGNSFSGGTFTVQISADGETYEDLATYTELGAVQTEVFYLTEDIRYIKWIYTEKVNGNVGLGNIAVIIPEEIVVTFNNRAEGYSTLFYGTKNLVIPEGVKAYTYKVGADGKSVETPYETYIPKGSAVVIELEDKSQVADAPFDVTFATTAASEPAHTDNMLLGFDEGGSTTVGPDDTKEYLFYSLSLNKNKDKGSIGFYWNQPNGAAFTINADHRAYLAVEKDVANGASAFTFDGTGTGINGIFANGLPADGVYTLSGVRFSSDSLQKGIYIVNGKKVVIK